MACAGVASQEVAGSWESMMAGRAAVGGAGAGMSLGRIADVCRTASGHMCTALLCSQPPALLSAGHSSAQPVTH